MIESRIREFVAQSIGIEIPKPEAKAPFRVKGFGTRRGVDAVIYTIPSHSDNVDHYEKGITFIEFEKAHSVLTNTGEMTHGWFNSALPGCAKEGSCNFTTIGGLFELMGIAKYTSRGTYSATTKA